MATEVGLNSNPSPQDPPVDLLENPDAVVRKLEEIDVPDWLAEALAECVSQSFSEFSVSNLKASVLEVLS